MLWKERLWILTHLPDLITMFLLADVAHLQQNNLVSMNVIVASRETIFGLYSGLLITVLHEHTWQHMD